jgi:hypothetical protein
MQLCRLHFSNSVKDPLNLFSYQVDPVGASTYPIFPGWTCLAPLLRIEIGSRSKRPGLYPILDKTS